MTQQGREGCRGHAGDPSCLAQGRRTDGGELRLAFRRKGTDGPIVQAGRQFQRLVAPEGQDVRLLAIEIAGIAPINLQLLGDGGRKIAKLRPEAAKPGKATMVCILKAAVME